MLAAAKLITQYGNLAAVVAAADDQTPKLKSNLHEHGERVTRNAAMMVLRRDVPVEVDLGALAPRPDMQATRRLFEFLEFKTMHKRVSDLAKDRGWLQRGDTTAVAGGETVTLEPTDQSIKVGETVTLGFSGGGGSGPYGRSSTPKARTSTTPTR